ncbi:unnamed protein product [Knipowitschia caucasica]
MSVFDLFRGFFGVPGHHGRRDPFFEAMTHDDDDDDDDEEDGFFYDGFRGDQQDPFDSAWRFGFSLGPDGMRIQEPPVFGHLLQEMEEMFAQMSRFQEHSDPGRHGVPRITPLPPLPPAGRGGGGSSGNPLRDFMLKSPDDPPPAAPREDPGSAHQPPFHGWTPLPKFGDILRSKVPERKQDGDLDSAVSAGGLEQIITPPAGQAPQQPRTRSFFKSVTVSKVVKPDGSVEERRTVRDGQGNEETTVTRSGPDHGAPAPVSDLPRPSSDLKDDSLFSKFFGGNK